ncbi:MAG TPA: GNAT family protein [Acidimicrobiia bacterium]|jgi:ribosomal-protein-alanine N-acetyltransferase|nr:GNAT family protein [Acidimicrobiia bacterium]HEV3451079.1 GNAT family protein [Acidimicrobiia bacterium]
MRRSEVLTGARVTLRPLKGGDWEAWREVRIRSREWLEAWEPLGEPGAPDPITDPEAFKARCGAWDRQRHFDAAYGFGIFLRKGSAFAGEVSLGSVQRGPFQSANVGYWIDLEHAGRGYMPEAVAVVLRFAFEDLGLHRVEAAIVPRNVKSRRVAEKLGLRDEGTSQRFLQIRGAWEDHVRYAITAEEWSARRDELEAEFFARR